MQFLLLVIIVLIIHDSAGFHNLDDPSNMNVGVCAAPQRKGVNPGCGSAKIPKIPGCGSAKTTRLIACSKGCSGGPLGDEFALSQLLKNLAKKNKVYLKGLELGRSGDGQWGLYWEEEHAEAHLHEEGGSWSGFKGIRM